MREFNLPPEGESFGPLTIDEICLILPHRYPFLLVDRVVKIIPNVLEDGTISKVGSKVHAQKHVSFNEPHFAGHFPNFPIMPGVLIIESMAQASAFVFYRQIANAIMEHGPDQTEVLLLGVDNARFKQPVRPGDLLDIEVECTKKRNNFVNYHCCAKVNDKLVARVDLLTSLRIVNQPKPYFQRG